MTDVEVHPLLLTMITTPDWHPIPNTRLPVYGYLVVHAQGPLLVDTGVGRGNAFIDAQYRPEHHALDEALAPFGVAIADVRGVINTHLHFDHAGQNQLFAGVPIYAQADEIEAARAPRYTIPEWVEFAGAAYLPLSGESEILPGVRVLPAPGHTPGHQVVAIESATGLVLLAGQTAETRAEFDSAETCRPWRKLRPARVYISHEQP